MLLVYGLIMAIVNSMDGLGFSFLYIDIIPFNPHSITSNPFNRYNRHNITAITYLKAHLTQRVQLDYHSFIYNYYHSIFNPKDNSLSKGDILLYINYLTTIILILDRQMSKYVKVVVPP